MKPSRATLRLLPALAATLLLASCIPPESDNPLSDPANAKPDERLDGVWVALEAGRPVFFRYLLFAAKKDGTSDIVMINTAGGADVTRFTVFPTTLGERRYMNLRGMPKEKPEEGKEKETPGYIFARYEIAEDGTLAIRPMDDQKILPAIGAGLLRGIAADEKAATRITEATDRLAEFVRASDAANPDALWEKDALRFRKLDGPPPEASASPAPPTKPAASPAAPAASPPAPKSPEKPKAPPAVSPPAPKATAKPKAATPPPEPGASGR